MSRQTVNFALNQELISVRLRTQAAKMCELNSRQHPCSDFSKAISFSISASGACHQSVDHMWSIRAVRVGVFQDGVAENVHCGLKFPFLEGQAHLRSNPQRRQFHRMVDMPHTQDGPRGIEVPAKQWADINQCAMRRSCIF